MKSYLDRRFQFLSLVNEASCAHDHRSFFSNALPCWGPCSLDVSSHGLPFGVKSIHTVSAWAAKQIVSVEMKTHTSCCFRYLRTSCLEVVLALFSSMNSKVSIATCRLDSPIASCLDGLWLFSNPYTDAPPPMVVVMSAAV